MVNRKSKNPFGISSLTAFKFANDSNNKMSVATGFEDNEPIQAQIPYSREARTLDYPEKINISRRKKK